MNSIFYIIILVLVIVFGPIISIWAINTLFFAGPAIAFAIPYTWKTWLAIIIFGGLLKANVHKS